MTTGPTTVGFDADDTLWHNERFFAMTQAHFAELLAEHTEKDHLMARLLEAERRNIPHYGFGIKGFTLSMIETAIEITQGQVPADVIREILDAGRDMLSHPIELMPDVEEVLVEVAKGHKILLITKGDLLDQTRKIEQSGLRDLFDAVEVVSHKDPETYGRVFARHGTGADQGLMVGNSMASDVIPMIEAGGWGIYVPHDIIWEIEAADAPRSSRFAKIDRLGEITSVLERVHNS